MEAGDERVIDLTDYLKRREETSRSRSTFAFWGGEGERSRFALPLWRAAYLVSGRRAALVWCPTGEETGRNGLRPLVVLDLAEDPPRVDDLSDLSLPGGGVEAPGCLAASREAVTVFLGDRGGRRWYLRVDDLDEPSGELGDGARDDLLFLAGECAGLLFHRGLDGEAEGEAGEGRGPGG